MNSYTHKETKNRCTTQFEFEQTVGKQMGFNFKRRGNLMMKRNEKKMKNEF